MKEPRQESEYPDYPESYHKFVAQGYEDDIPIEYEIYCPKCGSDWLIKASKDSGGEQRMQCKRCTHRFRYSAHMKESAFLLRLLFLHHKGYSATRIAKELEVHTSTITKYVEKYYPVLQKEFLDIINKLE